jgi:hypothetical protein
MRDVVGRLHRVLGDLRLRRALQQVAEVWEAPAALADDADREGRSVTDVELRRIKAAWETARTGAWREIQGRGGATPDEPALGWFAPLAKAVGDLDGDLQKNAPPKAILPERVRAVAAALRQALADVGRATESETEAATAAARVTFGRMVEG